MQGIDMKFKYGPWIHASLASKGLVNSHFKRSRVWSIEHVLAMQGPYDISGMRHQMVDKLGKLAASGKSTTISGRDIGKKN